MLAAQKPFMQAHLNCNQRCRRFVLWALIPRVKWRMKATESWLGCWRVLSKPFGWQSGSLPLLNLKCVIASPCAVVWKGMK